MAIDIVLESTELLAGTFEGIPLANVVISRDDKIAMMHVQAEKLFGYARGELLERPVELLVSHRFRGTHPGDRNKFMSAPQARPMGAGRDLTGLRKDGREFPVEIGLLTDQLRGSFSIRRALPACFTITFPAI